MKDKEKRREEKRRAVDLWADDVVAMQVAQEAYRDLGKTIEALDAVSQITYRSLYILDNYKKNLLFISDNPLFLCGKSVQEAHDLGYAFFTEHILPEDLTALREINHSAHKLFADIPVAERPTYSLSYNFHLRNVDGEGYSLVNHQATPLRMLPDGSIWLALCAVSLAPSSETGVAYMTSKSLNKQWVYRLSEDTSWQEVTPIELSTVEKTILQLSYQGFSNSEMSALLKKSENTIKGYRKSIFNKLGVSKISEAIARVVERQLI